MKWKCTECVAYEGTLETEGCEINVPHLDESMDGPPLCPWNASCEAVWEPVGGDDKQ